MSERDREPPWFGVSDGNTPDAERLGPSRTLEDARRALATEIKELLVDASCRVFALVDGAQFEDLPAQLEDAGLAYRSLYFSRVPRNRMLAGPWLVDFYRAPLDDDYLLDRGDDAGERTFAGEERTTITDASRNPDDLSMEGLQSRADQLAEQMRAALDLGDTTGGGVLPPGGELEIGVPAPLFGIEAQVDKFMKILGDRPAAVFWAGDESLTQSAIWKQGRTLNRVVIPRRFIAAGWEGIELPDEVPAEDLFDREEHTNLEGLAPTLPPPPPSVPEQYVGVTFRHTDGNVLAEVLPVLSPEELARVMGPARFLMFCAPDHPAPDTQSAFWVVGRPQPSGPTPVGFLRFSPSQMNAIRVTRIRRSRQRIARFLKRNIPDFIDPFSDSEIESIVIESETSGRRLGLHSEAAHMRWAYLMMLSNCQVAKAPEAVEFIRNDPDPDRAMRVLVEDTIAALQRGEGPPP